MWNIPSPPLPDTSDPFAPKPLRQLADIVAEYHTEPQPTSAAVSSAETAEQRMARKAAEEQYVADVHGWCDDCDVLLEQLRETVDRRLHGLPWKSVCYSCTCRRLGIPERTAEDEASAGYDGDSVADDAVSEGKQEL